VVKSCWRWHSRVGASRGVMLSLSYAGEDIVESCWRWRYRVGVDHGVMSLSSHAGDDMLLSQCWPWCDAITELYG
jgi:hypothetical protein